MFKRMRKQSTTENDVITAPSALEVLLNAPNLGRMDEAQRRKMTTSCRDTDYIPKVKDAGKVKTVKNKKVQVLHNGLIVEANGYVGQWMTDVIKDLKGHHEPQEEKAFYEVLKRLTKGATMIELGSYWSYYSLWFKKEIVDSRSICCEPDAANRNLGERNAALNDINDIEFLEAAAGSVHKEVISIKSDSDPALTIDVPIFSIDGLMSDRKIKKIDLLHMDVQGYEMDALKGAKKAIESKKVRFIFVSTHHYLFSKSPMTHADCLDFIKSLGGHIISSHTIPESFSGDGLIVASFDDKDKGFKVETSINHSDQSLFRPYEEDLNILMNAYTKETQRT